MPNLTSHLSIALRAMHEWKHPILNRHARSYLLGSASPDIRIITRQPRFETHFAPLDSDSVEAGVTGMLKRYPRLARTAELSEETSAFVAGYMSHLLSDQLWVIDIYRPYFGNSSVFAETVVGNVMDRALQLEMERQDRWIWAETVALLENAEDGIDLDFISPPMLKEWRHWVQGVPGREFTWERLRSMARRQYPGGSDCAQKTVEWFLYSIPEGLEWIYQHVPRAKIDEYRVRCITEFIRIASGYLR